MLPRNKTDERLVVLIAACASLVSFAHYFRSDQILLYGDAVAHIHIARRVLDSLTAGLSQLGTVWLPLPHVLMLPFVWIDAAWQSGWAGSIGSMAAYVAGVLGIYRLLSLVASRAGAWIGSVTFAANPNLLYLQSTAMTEAIYLAAMIWAALSFVEFWIFTRHHRDSEAGRALMRCPLALTAGCLTRYDGWFLTALLVLIAIGRYFWINRTRRGRLSKALALFVMISSFAPLLWLAYNQAIFGNPFEFATGPYSARAIAERESKDRTTHPGHQNITTANTYFLRAAKLNVGEGGMQHLLFALAVIAAGVAIIDRRFRSVLVLWVPWPFYTIAIAYSSVPIFMPAWPPFSYYNVRYGIQLLPAIAVFTAIAFEILRRVNWKRSYVAAAGMTILSFVIVSYASVWMHAPISFREARVNSRTRIAFESALAQQLRGLPPEARLLMFTGRHSGALQRAGVPLRRVVHESNDDLWQEALEAPGKSADLIIAIEGDAVEEAVCRNPAGLESLLVVKAHDGPRAVIYGSTARQR